MCCNVFTNSLNRSGADLGDARRWKIVIDRRASVVITLLENIPQIILSGIAKHQLGSTTPMFFITITGSILSVVWNLSWVAYQIYVLDRIAKQAKAQVVEFTDPCCSCLVVYRYEDICTTHSTAFQIDYAERTEGWVGLKKVSMFSPRDALDQPLLEENGNDKEKGLATA